jgi:hypothetical protein
LCHELLHVRRRDWLVTIAEEFGAALYWFHPGVWWLLSQARLSREQLVDAEVVRLTESREHYIAALLAVAGTKIKLDLAPAPLFLRKRHLTQRMHSLLTEVSMSKFRLVSSYAAIAAILAVVAWAMFLSFPLEGQAQVAETASESQILHRIVPRSANEESTEGESQIFGGVVGGLLTSPTAEMPAGMTTQDPPPPPPPPPPTAASAGSRYQGQGGRPGKSATSPTATASTAGNASRWGRRHSVETHLQGESRLPGAGAIGTSRRYGCLKHCDR